MKTGLGMGVVLWVILANPACADFLQDIGEKLENLSLEKLAQVQADPTNKLSKFKTDGCSSGMSSGWQNLADVFPFFKQQYGDHPPWEQCCIDHDRAYWRGEVVDGYAKRKRADETLKQCVTELGKASSQSLSKEVAMKPEEIESAYTIAGELMYKAVRIGGQPCTVFPWRWGYGWPMCPIVARKNHQQQ